MKVFTTPAAPSTRGRERATSRTPSHSGVNMEQVEQRPLVLLNSLRDAGKTGNFRPDPGFTFSFEWW